MGFKTDGTLWGCGNNASGQLGAGSGVSTVKTFTQIASDVLDIYSCMTSGYTSWIIKTDRTLWGTGNGNQGCQGNGSNSDVKEFTQRLTDVKRVACSNFTTWAVKTDGTLWGTGSGGQGQQGTGSTSNVTTFTQKVI